MLKILPQIFYESDHIEKLLVDGLSSIIYKKLDAPVYHKEGYVSAHAITVVLKGRLRVDNDKGRVTEVPEGKMIFLPKGLYTISDIIPDGSYFEAMVFFFEEDVLAKFINALPPVTNHDKCISHLLLDLSPELQEFTASLRKLYGNRSDSSRPIMRQHLGGCLGLSAWLLWATR